MSSGKRDELLKLVVSLSAACKNDKNVLKDAELVDALETRGRRIARNRTQQKKLECCISPRNKHTEQTLKQDKKVVESAIKRRKLPLHDDISVSCQPHCHDSKRESMGEWISSLQCKKKEVEAGLYRPTTPTTVSASVEVTEEAVMLNPLKPYQHRRSVSPQLKVKRIERAASPSQEETLSVSSTSTMASYYDMCDDSSVLSEAMRRYTRSAMDRTPSFESLDWADDESNDEVPFRSIADDVDPVSRVLIHPRTNAVSLSGINEDETAATDEKQVENVAGIVMEVLNQVMDYKESISQAQVTRLVECRLKSLPVQESVTELKTRLAVAEEALSMQENLRREAEAAFQMELDSKTELVLNLQRELEEKNTQLQNSVKLPAGEVTSPSEVAHKQTLVEKDREICRLNCQLSTKLKLVDEIARKMVEHLQAQTSSVTRTDFRLDLDMFLFKSVAAKQAVIDELNAALSSTEREVSELEARVAKKSREMLLLKTKFKSMASRVKESSIKLSHLENENDRLVTRLKEKQNKMRDIIEFLEGKEMQVMQLENEVRLRQSQLEQVVTEFEKMQQNKKKSPTSLRKAAVSVH